MGFINASAFTEITVAFIAVIVPAAASIIIVVLNRNAKRSGEQHNDLASRLAVVERSLAEHHGILKEQTTMLHLMLEKIGIHPPRPDTKDDWT